jgi:3-keto-5-aminohexanoate cleavage enzyme
MEKLVIGVHPNENTMRDPNPNVPWTPEEIADVVAGCVAEGASVTHFHGRDHTGAPDHSAATYGQIYAAIRSRCGALLAPSLANVAGYTIDERVANVVGKPDEGSSRPEFLVAEMGCAVMDLWDPVSRRFLTDDRLFSNGTSVQLALLKKARELEMTPWLVSFNAGWSRAIQAHLDSGQVLGAVVLQFVLGGPEFLAANPSTVGGLDAHMAMMPTGHLYQWFVSSYRGDLFRVAPEVIQRGGHLSIGVGDFHYGSRGYPSNERLVAEIRELSQSLGREVATPDEARTILGLHDYSSAN